MRLALHQASEVGTRAGRILLAERPLKALGLVDKHPTEKDPRLEHVEVLATYDALLSDAADPRPDIEMALNAGVSCVVWVDADELGEEYGDDFAAGDLRLLTGCNLATGIAPALAAHEVAATENVLEVTIAWTEPGSPRRRGEAIPFPDPIGSRWGEARLSEYADRSFVAKVGGPWAAAMAKVTGASPAGVVTRIVGVSDLAVHLEALAFASGAVLVGELPPGLSRPTDLAEQYLAKALDAGLDVAAHTHHGN
ncbi:MAG: hypothetical protein QNJ75_01470 [Acidimicrobiia bacterium]|nr:hypothetical protein [Acidimicrobiia bacterium]